MRWYLLLAKESVILERLWFQVYFDRKMLAMRSYSISQRKRENSIAKVNWPKTDYNISTEWCSLTLFTNAKTNAQNVSTWDQTNVKTIHIILLNWIKMVSNKSSTASESAVFFFGSNKIPVILLLNIHKILNTIFRFLLMRNSLNAIYSWNRLKYSKKRNKSLIIYQKWNISKLIPD